ncbi:ATP-dependent RNA helicase vasa [Eumeta japonica]|uniref:ATP-dependent RNA helicase vasa n=1 Tax=Eumeta variegata TaxID=151549 RepID=A0A4C1SRC8_EUMVA|nr:ATP-dependent RNA helicase vasa [Eumeta japonica]
MDMSFAEEEYFNAMEEENLPEHNNNLMLEMQLPNSLEFTESNLPTTSTDNYSSVNAVRHAASSLRELSSFGRHVLPARTTSTDVATSDQFPQADAANNSIASNLSAGDIREQLQSQTQQIDRQNIVAEDIPLPAIEHSAQTTTDSGIQFPTPNLITTDSALIVPPACARTDSAQQIALGEQPPLQEQTVSTSDIVDASTPLSGIEAQLAQKSAVMWQPFKTQSTSANSNDVAATNNELSVVTQQNANIVGAALQPIVEVRESYGGERRGGFGGRGRGRDVASAAEVDVEILIMIKEIETIITKATAKTKKTVTGENAPAAIQSFEEANLRDIVLNNIKRSAIQHPHPYKTAIPTITSGRDLMACAQTGSGKTAAFLLPIINSLLSENAETSIGKPHALIVSPTRRLIDFVEKGMISFEDTRFVVLDEADRMLDMGFKENVSTVMNHPTMRPMEERQNLMFSATFPAEIQRMAGEYLNEYIFISIGVVGGACSDVTQNIYEVKKFQNEILQENPDGTIVLLKPNVGQTSSPSLLSETEFPTTSIHGDRLQSQREMALADFKSGNNGRATSFFDPEHDSAIAADLVNILEGAGQEVPDFLKEYSSGGGSGRDFGSKFGGRDVRKGVPQTDDNFVTSSGPSALEEEEDWN